MWSLVPTPTFFWGRWRDRPQTCSREAATAQPMRCPSRARPGHIRQRGLFYAGRGRYWMPAVDEPAAIPGWLVSALRLPGITARCRRWAVHGKYTQRSEERRVGKEWRDG